MILCNLKPPNSIVSIAICVRDWYHAKFKTCQYILETDLMLHKIQGPAVRYVMSGPSLLIGLQAKVLKNVNMDYCSSNIMDICGRAWTVTD